MTSRTRGVTSATPRSAPTRKQPFFLGRGRLDARSPDRARPRLGQLGTHERTRLPGGRARDREHLAPAHEQTLHFGPVEGPRAESAEDGDLMATLVHRPVAL